MIAPLLILSFLLQSAPPTGFTPLFDGHSFTGWRGRPHLDPAVEASWGSKERARHQRDWDRDLHAHWRIEDGCLVNDGHGVFLTTAKDYGDFELLLEYRTVPLADSGIYLRATPQVQIWDTTKEGGKWGIGADKGSGGLWNNQVFPRDPLVKADRPFGEWNQLRIRLVGARVSVWLNDQRTVDMVPLENYWDRGRPLPARGPIQLQTHGGEIRFRSLSIHEIDPEEANRILAARDPKDWRQVFDGRTFQGWSGDRSGYEIVDGALRCKEGHGGNLYTSAEWGDFQARFQFLLPPGGNNGLAIRYPGAGDTAYVGMCELQILDDGDPRYARIQPWQAHGSVYGQIPAVRGYLRPAGTWNFEEVTVRGTRIRVELNGSIILDADVGGIRETPDGHEHPGRLRSRGHFGFAGHGDPVAFRDIWIRTPPR